MFTKHTTNPVLDLGASGEWDDTHVFSPTMLYINNTWYLYYSGYGGSTTVIGLATSKDGITFTKYSGNPVLNHGTAGTWDSADSHTPRVLYRNHMFYMYYSGNNGSIQKIGLATSKDGRNWTRHTANPVLDLGASGEWDQTRLYDSTVIYRNNKWYMYYGGRSASNYEIGLATSVDGINWSRYSGNPVLQKGAVGEFDETYVDHVDVDYRNHTWYLYYSGRRGSYYDVGLATSPDGMNFTKYSGNPVLNRGANLTWDDFRVYVPTMVYKNNNWYMYYIGSDGTNIRIGEATSPTGV